MVVWRSGLQVRRLSPEGRLIIEAEFQKVFQIHLSNVVHNIPGGIEVKANYQNVRHRQNQILAIFHLVFERNAAHHY